MLGDGLQPRHTEACCIQGQSTASCSPAGPLSHLGTELQHTPDGHRLLERDVAHGHRFAVAAGVQHSSGVSQLGGKLDQVAAEDAACNRGSKVQIQVTDP